MKLQTTFTQYIEKNAKLEAWIHFFQSKKFELSDPEFYNPQTKEIRLTYSKSIDCHKHFPFEPIVYKWSELEQKILREAKIPIPECRFPPTIVSTIISVIVIFRNLKRKIDGTIHYIDFERKERVILSITKDTDMNEIAFQLEGIMDTLNDTYNKQKIISTEKYNKDFEEGVEYYLQYKQNCELLKGYLNEYFHSSPEIELINTINIQVQKIENSTYPDPSTYKPTYNPETNIMTICDGHRIGVFHINTEYSIIKNTLVFFVSTWSARDKFCQKRAQSYFFEPITKQFLTRKSNRIKELGEISDWKYSFWWSSVQLDEKYRCCFVCGSRLHFPAIPTKILDVWVYQIKPCCACFSKMRSDPLFEQQTIQKYIEKYQNEFEIEQEKKDQKKESNNPLIMN